MKPNNDTSTQSRDRFLRIGVDFDGVLFDHVPYLLRGFRDAHDIDLAAEGLRHWDFFQYRAVREKDLTWSCVQRVLHKIEMDPALHLNPPRDLYAATVIRRWREQGHQVDIVTARDHTSREVTELFLETHGIEHDNLRTSVSVKTGYDVLIDDAPHNVLMAAADGTRALLMDHPYNRDVPAHRNPLRVKNWRDVELRVSAPPVILNVGSQSVLGVASIGVASSGVAQASVPGKF